MTFLARWLLFLSILLSMSTTSAEFLTLNISSQLYLLSDYTRSFTLADGECDVNGGVIEFETNAEYFAVTKYLATKFPKYGDIWVKIRAIDTNNDKKYDSFAWRNEMVNRSLWDTGEPNENCVNVTDECHVRIIVADQKLRDRPGSSEFYFMCRARNECAEKTANNCSQNCIDLDVGFACSCRDGYVIDSDLASCRDIDECGASPSPCSQQCSNTIGSYACSCQSGFELGLNGTCRDVDECITTSTSPCSQRCNNTVGSYVCDCHSGFYIATNGTCMDIDECNTSNEYTHSCTNSSSCNTMIASCSQICYNTIGSYTCGCRSGYRSFSNGSCVDIDECKHNPRPCNYTCSNTIGSYTCGCRSGFQTGDDGTCLDIDECNGGTALCDQICNNTLGSFLCTCRTGYAYDGSSNVCKDIDECLDSPCMTSCKNTDGSYVCECETGYTLSFDGFVCKDLDECLLPVKICQQSCINTLGSYLCECRAGYILDDKDNSSCTDFDECSKGSVSCGEGGNCVNTDGGYHCACREGYIPEGDVCIDVNECLNTTSNSCLQRCNNTLGGYSCYCDVHYYLHVDNVTCVFDPCSTAQCQHECIRQDVSYVCACRSGFYRDPNDLQTCHDLDECTVNISSCERVCTNTAGSYTCSCHHGYILAPDGHSCVTKLSRDQCPCSCSAHRFSDIEVLRQEILKELKIDKKNISSYWNSLKSREDTNQTSVTIGYCGIIFLVTVFGFVIGLDILSAVKCIYVFYTRKKSDVNA